MIKRVYETTVIYDGVLPEDTIRREIGTVKSFLEGEDVVHRVDEWGRRELAYTIKKRKSGFYVLFVHGGKVDTTKKLGRLMRLNENILRFLTISADPELALAPPRKTVIPADPIIDGAADAGDGRDE